MLDARIYRIDIPSRNLHLRLFSTTARVRAALIDRSLGVTSVTLGSQIELNELLKQREKSLYGSQRKLTGISYNALWKISNGKVQGITFNVLEKICVNLGCEAGDLLAIANKASGMHQTELLS